MDTQQMYKRLQKAEVDIANLQIDLKQLKDVVEHHLQIHPIICKDIGKEK